MADRRDFIKSLGALPAGLWLSRTGWTAESRTDALGTVLPARTLGRTGVSVTQLCVGGYHFGSGTEKESEAIAEAAIEGGIRFFDNAVQYQNGGAEERMGKYVVPKYREHIFLMTKSKMKTRKEAEAELERSLRRLNTEYLDLWQVHSLDSVDDVNERVENGVLDAFVKAKESGKVRYIGFTGHVTPDAHLRMLELTRDSDIFDTCQMPINLADPGYSSFILRVLPKLVERNMGVLAMKTLAFGNFLTLERDGKRVIPGAVSLEEALGFVWSLPVSSLVTGAETADQLREKIAIAKTFEPMDEAERTALIEKVSPFAGNGMESYKA